MHKEKEQLIVAKDDHEIIVSHLKHGLNRSTFSRKEAEALAAELKKARLVEKEKLPEDVVCLNSTVTVKEEKGSKAMEITLVTPEKADIKQRRVSIYHPLRPH
jgi:regulator of nucleoside diphosphate kinase